MRVSLLSYLVRPPNSW